jgi:hypothetical protein
MLLNDSHYVPVLRWKAAERESLQWLGKAERSRMMPLFEVIPNCFRNKDGKLHPIRKTLRKIATEIDDYWGDSSAFIDLGHLVDACICSAETDPHVLEIITDEIRRLRPLLPQASKLIPVTGLGRPQDYQNAVKSIVEADKTGVCLRISLREVTGGDLARRMEELLSRLKLDVVDADLVVDLKSPDNNWPNLPLLCEAIPMLSNWRSFVVLAGAFPKDLQNLEKNSQHSLPRNEWFYWREQVLTLPRKLRRPTFGDYTIQHAAYEEPPENSNPSASIRYTHSDHWVVMRGEGLKNEDGPGNAQYPAEAQILCESDEFCGAEFSLGDRYIFETSRTPETPGTPFTWIRAGINHHMVFTVRQIADFVGDRVLKNAVAL